MAALLPHTRLAPTKPDPYSHVKLMPLTSAQASMVSGISAHCSDAPCNARRQLPNCSGCLPNLSKVNRLHLSIPEIVLLGFRSTANGSPTYRVGSNTRCGRRATRMEVAECLICDAAVVTACRLALATDTKSRATTLWRQRGQISRTRQGRSLSPIEANIQGSIKSRIRP
jgi:hypothetical protein